MLQIQTHCDVCNALFTTSVLDCRKGGLVIQRQDLAWSQTVKEPLVDTDSPDTGLSADVHIRGIWQPQCTSLFDIRVLDSDAPSYMKLSPEVVLRNTQRERRWRNTLNFVNKNMLASLCYV